MKQFFVGCILSVLALASFAQDPSLRKKHFNLDNGVALAGYDAVSYLNQSKAVKGNKNFSLAHEGITYNFSSAANKEEFTKNPSKYEPAYGGWCAYAMGSDGEKVSIDPKTFKIVNGKLNLFYNKFFNNTLEDWNKDETNLKKKADANWQKTFH
ncbi:MAG: YHS domain protein [Chitinophagaceae bacterium]|nr:YHS domain protein [Chitinophagaceae bacterium]